MLCSLRTAVRIYATKETKQQGDYKVSKQTNVPSSFLPTQKITSDTYQGLVYEYIESLLGYLDKEQIKHKQFNFHYSLSRSCSPRQAQEISQYICMSRKWPSFIQQTVVFVMNSVFSSLTCFEFGILLPSLLLQFTLLVDNLPKLFVFLLQLIISA